MGPRESIESALLSKLGANDRGAIFEVILSTCDIAGAPNAAPMGIQFVREKRSPREHKILTKPFKSTTTYRNLQSQREAVISVTSDPALFYRTAFKRNDATGNLMSLFANSKTVRPPRIKGCGAYIEVSVESIRDADSRSEERSEVLCRVKSVEVEKTDTKLYCRAPHLLIELIIHATRVKELVSQGLMEEAHELIKTIHRYRNLIHRIAPSSQHEAIAEELFRILDERSVTAQTKNEDPEGQS